MEENITIPWLASLLTLIAIPYAFLQWMLYKSKHKVVFVPSETYYEVTLVDHPNKPQSLWLHLMVKNRGFEVSRNAEAYITKIWEKEGSKFNALASFRSPVKLKWAHEPSIAPIDILPKHSRRLDVCYICDNEEILHLMAEGYPSGTIRNALPVGNYLFEIVIVSKNALRPTRFLFLVEWDGKWENFRGKSYVRSFRLTKSPAKSFRFYNNVLF
ncbi:MAG: hypothetical protein HYT69_00540 [Candidatus Zambryskibacteria bacterium]|nr:hypothetical protein [Candidatus Zambryskibacteria bacterium]